MFSIHYNFHIFRDPVVVIPVLMVLGLMIWSVRLWRNPHHYNPSSFFYRYLYLWYAGRTDREVNDTFMLTDKEVEMLGKKITLMGILFLIFVFTLPFFVAE